MKNIKNVICIAMLCVAIASCNGGTVTEYSLEEYLTSLKDEAVDRYHQEVAETKVTIDGSGNVVIQNDNLSVNVTEWRSKFDNVTQMGTDLFEGNKTQFSDVAQMGMNLFNKGNDTQKNMAAEVQNTTLVAKEEVRKSKLIGSYKPVQL